MDSIKDFYNKNFSGATLLIENPSVNDDPPFADDTDDWTVDAAVLKFEGDAPITAEIPKNPVLNSKLFDKLSQKTGRRFEKVECLAVCNDGKNQKLAIIELLMKGLDFKRLNGYLPDMYLITPKIERKAAEHIAYLAEKEHYPLHYVLI